MFVSNGFEVKPNCSNIFEVTRPLLDPLLKASTIESLKLSIPSAFSIPSDALDLLGSFDSVIFSYL